MSTSASAVFGSTPGRALTLALLGLLVAFIYARHAWLVNLHATYRMHAALCVALLAVLTVRGHKYLVHRSTEHSSLIDGLLKPLQKALGGTIRNGIPAQIDWLNQWWLAALPLSDIQCRQGQPIVLSTEYEKLQLLVAARPQQDVQIFLVDPTDSLEPRLSLGLDPPQREQLSELRAHDFRIDLRRGGVRLKIELGSDGLTQRGFLTAAIEKGSALLQRPCSRHGQRTKVTQMPVPMSPPKVSDTEFRLAALDRALVAAISGGQASMIYEVLRKRAKLLAGTDAATASLAVQAVADHLTATMAPENKVVQWQRWARALDRTRQTVHPAQAA